MSLIKVSIFLLPMIFIGQTKQTIVEKVSIEICADLSQIENIDKATKSEVQFLMGKVFLENKIEWDAQLNKIENSRNNGYNIFDPLLNHRLLLSCAKYRKVEHLLDENFEENPTVRAMYLKTKDFVITAELGASEKTLLSYIDTSKRKDSTQVHLASLQKEVMKFTEKTNLHFVWSEYEENGSVFFINNYNCISGEPNYYLKIVFDNKNDNLIDAIIFVDRIKIEEERKNRDDLNLEFIPPPPPPPLKKNN